MRYSENIPRPNAQPNSAPALGKPDAGARSGSDGGTRSLDAMESALAVVLERVGRLEDDVRQLRSQNANRS